MRRIRHAATLLAFGAVIPIAAAQQPSNSSSMQNKMDAIFAPLVDGHSPGVAVLVVKNGKTPFERGFGLRDLNASAKIDEHTNFRLASCSKQFTAIAIMLLVHDGKLRYDQKLTEIFPGFPAYGRPITIRNLLNHTGGLQDYETLMERADAPDSKYPFPHDWTAENQIQDAEVLTLLEQTDHGMFAPGTQWYYSNSGYVVLGLIVAKVSGQPFREFLRERIFVPLHMDNTVAYQRGKNEVANRAYGHTAIDHTPSGQSANAKTNDTAKWQETDQSPTSATLGDGGMYSSLEDLTKWDEALRANKLLSKEEMQPALTPFTFADQSQPRWPANSDRPEGSSVSYGFGWFLDPYRGHPRMWHYGETMGFRSYIVRFPSDHLTIIVLCNRTDIAPESLALRLADFILDTQN
jgi:CubicO group peptidase (beta-lactamase class C family)